MAKKKNAGTKYFGKALTDDPDDAPELLNDFFRHGELRHGDSGRISGSDCSTRLAPIVQAGSKKMGAGRTIHRADYFKAQLCQWLGSERPQIS